MVEGRRKEEKGIRQRWRGVRHLSVKMEIAAEEKNRQERTRKSTRLRVLVGQGLVLGETASEGASEVGLTRSGTVTHRLTWPICPFAHLSIPATSTSSVSNWSPLHQTIHCDSCQR